MIKKTVYISQPSYLSLKNNQLVIKIPQVEKQEDLSMRTKEDLTRTLPIEDIGVILLDNMRITLTHALIDAFVQNNTALLTCNKQGLPVGMLLPLTGNTLQSERFQKQLQASLPLMKQLWQQTVKCKIRNQAVALQRCQGTEVACMDVWANEVRSGDPTNLEARAAVYYWKNLFPDKDFRRDRHGPPPNNLLNYGYAILRGIVARALVSSGLLPTVGIHHHNRYNAYCLADDIMEPYRPYVDMCVFEMCKKRLPSNELTQEDKKALLQIHSFEVTVADKKGPLMIAVAQTTASLAKCFTGQIRKIAYPTLS